MQQSKRKRDPTFTIEEKNILIDGVQKYLEVIESKKTDHETMHDKRCCWEQVAEEYNSTATCRRSIVVLKNCWKNLKAEGRKVFSEERLVTIQTDDGTEEEICVDPTIQRVIDLIRPTAVCLHNQFDSYASIKSEDHHDPETENLERTLPNEHDERYLNGDKSEQNLEQPATRPLTVERIAAKRSKPYMENSTRRLLSRRRPVYLSAKNEEVFYKRTGSLASLTSHAKEEHQIVMEIHREKLRQEKIRTRILLLELKEAKKNFKSDCESIQIEMI